MCYPWGICALLRRKFYLSKKSLKPITLQKMNLETLSTREEVMAYYGASAMIVKYLSETYGDEKVFKRYQALGQYPQ